MLFKYNFAAEIRRNSGVNNGSRSAIPHKHRLFCWSHHYSTYCTCKQPGIVGSSQDCINAAMNKLPLNWIMSARKHA